MIAHVEFPTTNHNNTHNTGSYFNKVTALFRIVKLVIGTKNCIFDKGSN